LQRVGASCGPRLVAFTSVDAHYSYKKSARVLGLGDDNLCHVGIDASTGELDPEALRKAMWDARAAGGEPFFVGSSAGTTVRGAIDPIAAIQDVIDDYNREHTARVWHHVDGSWAGPLLWSHVPSRRGLLGGIERCDSFAVNPHKLMNISLTCALLITSPARRGMLASANSTNAKYLFQPDKLFTELDTGDKTIMCGRKPDAFKLWLSWKALGDAGLAHRVDRALDLAEHAARRVWERQAADGALQMVHLPQFANVCFRVVPSALRAAGPLDGTVAIGDGPAADAARASSLHRVAPLVKARMQKSGDALVGFQSLSDNEPNYFRLVISQSEGLDEEMIDKLLDRMVMIAEDVQDEAMRQSKDM